MIEAFPIGAEPQPPNLAMNRVTMRFLDPVVERQFAIDRLVRAMPAIRAFLFAAFVLYALFGIADPYIIPNRLHAIWAVRYGLVCPAMFVVFVLSYTRIFRYCANIIISGGLFVSGTGVIIMTWIADPPGNALYYAGLILVVIYCAGLTSVRWIYHASISIVLGLMYQAVALRLNPISVKLLVNNDFFLAMSIGIGIFSSYVQEWYVRRDFVSAQIAQAEQARSERLRVAAEAASRAKSEFLAVMSHELRTPLNAVIGFAEMMQHEVFGPLGSERYVGYVGDIRDTAGHLLAIISDILDLTKAEVGHLSPHEEDVDLVQVLDQSIRILRDKASSSGLRISFDQPPSFSWVRADSRLIRQVVLNVLGNAIKFTPSGGTVSVSLKETNEGGWSIMIADTGIGISADNIPRVTEPFYQVEGAFARQYQGAGIGLPLVKRIMELHGGSLVIESALGVGTTVISSFPAERTISAPMLETGTG